MPRHSRVANVIFGICQMLSSGGRFLLKAGVIFGNISVGVFIELVVVVIVVAVAL